MANAPYARRKPAYVRRLAKRAKARVEYSVQQPSSPPPSGARACSRRQEGDEYVCHCGLRWDTHEDRPGCPHNGGF